MHYFWWECQLNQPSPLSTHCYHRKQKQEVLRNKNLPYHQINNTALFKFFANFSHMLLKMDFCVADTCKNMKPFKIIFRNKGIHLTEEKVNIEVWKWAEQSPLQPFVFLIVTDLFFSFLVFILKSKCWTPISCLSVAIVQKLQLYCVFERESIWMLESWDLFIIAAFK